MNAEERDRHMANARLLEQLTDLEERIEAATLIAKHMNLPPLTALARSADEDYQARLQRARDLLQRSQEATYGPRPPLHTWRLLKGSGRRQIGYLLEWIERPEGDVLVLPAYPGAELIPSRWTLWTEGLDLMTQLAIEGALAHDQVIMIEDAR